MNSNPSFSESLLDILHDVIINADSFYKTCRIERVGNQYKALNKYYPFYSDCTKAIDEAEKTFNKNCKILNN